MASFTVYVDGDQIAEELGRDEEECGRMLVTLARIFAKSTDLDRENLTDFVEDHIYRDDVKADSVAAFAELLLEAARSAKARIAKVEGR